MMKQLIETTSGVKYYTIPGISGKIRSDIAYLRENLNIISEEYEVRLVKDLEMFLVDDIAEEIKLSLYDPLQENKVYIEYCYKVEPFSTYYSEEKYDRQVRIRDFPETCLFDIFIYFTSSFTLLKSETQQSLLKDFNLDWYEIDFKLGYKKNDKRKRAGFSRFKETFINRYIYESPEVEGRSINSGHVDMRPGAPARQDADRRDINSMLETKLVEAIQDDKKLNYVVYKDMECTVSAITHVLRQYQKISIRWSLSRGFVVDGISERSEVCNAVLMLDIKNPAAALNFIVENREERVSYIFEDFHHHIESASAVNTQTAEIRSLIRDLSRVLSERDEFVFFLSPSENLPIEIAPLFNRLKQETGGMDISFLNRYGSVMTDPALCSRNKPLIRKDDKIKRIIQVLCQMETNNPILVGGAGVGKTALVEGLASEIVKGNVPPMLKDKTLFSLNLNTLVAGSKYRGDFEERINRLMEEVKACRGDIIVFIDEIHVLLGAGSAEGASGAEDILKPALSRGDFPCIGATTYEGYECLLRDPALARRFQRLEVPPATIKEAIDILFGVRHVFEKHHGVRISDEAVKAAVGLSEKLIHSRSLPGKAIRLLDGASAFVKLDGRQKVYSKDIDDEIKMENGL